MEYKEVRKHQHNGLGRSALQKKTDQLTHSMDELKAIAMTNQHHDV